jgi:PEP-CTERM motif
MTNQTLSINMSNRQRPFGRAPIPGSQLDQPAAKRGEFVGYDMKTSVKMTLMSGLPALALAMSAPASAAPFVVDAFTHSINSGVGTGLSTIALTAGQAFTITSSTNDLWSSGALPRFSDANGLIANRFATAADDSGQPIGTLIGQDFGLPVFNGHSSAFGSLVGRIGGVYQTLGANFSGPAWNTGTLELFYWDSFSDDNAGNITFDISTAAVPEPASWALMIMGFGLVGSGMRRRRISLTYA